MHDDDGISIKKGFFFHMFLILCVRVTQNTIRKREHIYIYIFKSILHKRSKLFHLLFIFRHFYNIHLVFVTSSWKTSKNSLFFLRYMYIFLKYHSISKESREQTKKKKNAWKGAHILMSFFVHLWWGTCKNQNLFENWTHNLFTQKC